ncbi:hypothetical protein F2Q70_00037929 [Brassica cretica]|uniref:Uncharacterized protein n=1 Tax=Brassica cretica TaxID=69181 RepID=A0A8S9MJ08_BRACR|nr:hypothetical protein F2Q70_00037929 [Brassica cretica]KAF2617891.1 hypothetical protein F2Q68_00038201 [Brassica cretica]
MQRIFLAWTADALHGLQRVQQAGIGTLVIFFLRLRDQLRVSTKFGMRSDPCVVMIMENFW